MTKILSYVTVVASKRYIDLDTPDRLIRARDSNLNNRPLNDEFCLSDLMYALPMANGIHLRLEKN